MIRAYAITYFERSPPSSFHVYMHACLQPMEIEANYENVAAGH